MNCESVHFLGWPTVRRSHLPRQDGAANALQRVFRPGNPSPRQRNFGESSWMDELSVISSVSVSFCKASRSHRITTRSPKSKRNEFLKKSIGNFAQFHFSILPSANLLYGGSLWHALAAFMTSNSTQYLKLEKIMFD